MTGLSYRSVRKGTIVRTQGLARLSLPMAVVLFLSGCFDAPPEYKVADRLPPVIDSRGVDPSVTTIVGIASTQKEIPFTVPFRSDDAGEDLWAFFVENIPQQVNYAANPCQVCTFIDQVSVPVDSRPFSEQDGRHVSYTWTLPAGKTGCSTVTVILSHKGNFIRGWQVADTADSAQVTWTFQFLDSNGTGTGCAAGTVGTTP